MTHVPPETEFAFATQCHLQCFDLPLFAHAQLSWVIFLYSKEPYYVNEDPCQRDPKTSVGKSVIPV